jgi:hypothetical protein
MSDAVDFSKMKLSELIQFAEEQVRIEREQGLEYDLEQLASWEDTLAALRYMQNRGWPEDYSSSGLKRG